MTINRVNREGTWSKVGVSPESTNNLGDLCYWPAAVAQVLLKCFCELVDVGSEYGVLTVFDPVFKAASMLCRRQDFGGLSNTA